MKKTVKHPDGREELIEGSPEEIAEYERKLQKESPKPKKKDILKGKSAADCPCDPCVRAREFFKQIPQVAPPFDDPFPYEPAPLPWYPVTPYTPPIWTRPDHGGMCACPQCCPPMTWTSTSSDIRLRLSPYEHEFSGDCLPEEDCRTMLGDRLKVQ